VPLLKPSVIRTQMNAWQELSRPEAGPVWDRFYADFQFRPSTTEWPGIREPPDSVTYGIGHVYGDPERYTHLTNDLGTKMVAAFQSCVADGEAILVLDWQHPCYRFVPHAPFAFETEDDWPVPALPNGDYYIFLGGDLSFGVFGHPWEQTMCVFGKPLLTAFGNDLPLLFNRPLRARGKAG
jgi:Protein of unknown function (DUF2716)